MTFYGSFFFWFFGQSFRSCQRDSRWIARLHTHYSTHRHTSYALVGVGRWSVGRFPEHIEFSSSVDLWASISGSWGVGFWGISPCRSSLIPAGASGLHALVRGLQGFLALVGSGGQPCGTENRNLTLAPMLSFVDDGSNSRFGIKKAPPGILSP